MPAGSMPNCSATRSRNRPRVALSLPTTDMNSARKARCIADSAGASYGLMGRGPQMFMLTAVPARGVTPEMASAALKTEVERIARDGISETELQRVKTQWTAGEIYKLDSVFNQARELGVAWTLGLPPDYGAQLIARLRQVTPAQVQAVAQKYFGDDSLTVATLRPQPLSGQPRARRALPGARH